MKSKNIFSLFLLSILFLSYRKSALNDYASLNHKSSEISFNLGDVDSLIKNETDSNSKNISLSHFVGVGDGDEFDTDSFQLEMPITFLKKSTDSIDLSTSYYFESNHNIVLKFYEWNTKESLVVSPLNLNTAITDIDLLNKLLTQHFKKKFDDLENIIDSEFGHPYFKNIESNKRLRKNETMKDDVYWEKNGVKVHLYRFSNRHNDFNQIRTLIYRK